MLLLLLMVVVSSLLQTCIYTTLSIIADDLISEEGDTFNLADTDAVKVRLTSDILDTLWHRAEVSINQVHIYQLHQLNVQCISAGAS